MHGAMGRGFGQYSLSVVNHGGNLISLQFFLETWHEIQANPVLRARADHTKSLPPSHISGTTLERTETTIFDELMAQYGALSARSEAMIVRQVCGEVESDLKGYFARWVLFF